MQGKRSFVLYADLKTTFDVLDDAQAGQLIKLIFDYVNDLEPEPTDPILKIAFAPIKQQLKRDLYNWKEKLAKRSQSGKIGGFKSGQSRSKTKQNEANEANASKSKQTQANEAVNVNVTVNVNEIQVQHQQHARELFSENGSLDLEKIQMQISGPARSDTGEFKKLTEQFNAHLVTENKHHADYHEWKKHLRNWINTRPRGQPEVKKAGKTQNLIEMVQNIQKEYGRNSNIQQH